MSGSWSKLNVTNYDGRGEFASWFEQLFSLMSREEESIEDERR
jgi:hypothetical protein